MKFLSICIPTYEMNGLGNTFLRYSFEILTRQTFKDFEVIISDHSKTDLIKDLCSEYKGKLTINYYRNPKNIGSSSANINNAIKKAEGKLIKILFQDDFLNSNRSLEEIIQCFDLTKDNWLITACENFEDGATLHKPFYPRYNHKIHLGNNTISSPSVLTIRNDHPLLFDENLIWLMDCDYYKRCFNMFGGPRILNKINVVNRIGAHQVTHTLANELLRKNEYIYILLKYNEKMNLITKIVNKTENLKKYFTLKNYLSTLRSIIKKSCKRSYAQSGEDLIVKYIFDARGIKNPTYIDIGAHDPAKINNTKIFYDSGSRGINIEPNLTLFKKFTKHRKKDINLNVGVSDYAGELDFYILSVPTLSTFSKTEAYKIVQEQNLSIKEVRRISVLTINTIINKYNHGKYPDFLSIDIEGLDEKVVRSIDFSNVGPKVICIETISYSTTGRGKKDDNIVDFLKNNGYIVYADTNINTIFVRKDVWEI